MYESNRFDNRIVVWLDKVSYYFMHCWITATSYFLSCYIPTYNVKYRDKLFEYCIFGPLLFVLAIALLPIGIIGIFLWIILCLACPQQKYTYVSFEEGHVPEKDIDDMVFTVVTANLLLATEFISRLNNIRHSWHRTKQIAACIINHNSKHVCNVETQFEDRRIKNKYHSILTEFPRADFLCLQEVWERSFSKLLINELKLEFPYILFDVGEFSWKINHFMIGSGLMFASKKPILEADFKTFTYRTKHAKYVSQGILCAKILLYYSFSGARHVGFISNLHTQAYQGKEPVILSQLDEVLIFVHNFRRKNTDKADVVQFDIICGDFNADNMSPGDRDIQGHTLFDRYEDFCVKEPGVDHEWAVGTEMRQTAVHFADASDPEKFKEILVDDSLRRMYILDADVLIHDRNLVTSSVLPDKYGNIEVTPNGGKRRIDRILTNKSNPVYIIGYGFLTALTNNTDHLPVCMSFVTRHDLCKLLSSDKEGISESTYQSHISEKKTVESKKLK